MDWNVDVIFDDSELKFENFGETFTDILEFFYNCLTDYHSKLERTNYRSIRQRMFLPRIAR